MSKYRVTIPLPAIGAALQFNPELVAPGTLKLKGRLIWPNLGVSINGTADVHYDAQVAGPLGVLVSHILKVDPPKGEGGTP